jgi:hypothetical protein
MSFQDMQLGIAIFVDEKIVHELQDTDFCNSAYDHIVDETKQLAQSSSGMNSSAFEEKVINKKTHALVRRAKLCNDLDVWLQTVPLDIGLLLFSELRV